MNRAVHLSLCAILLLQLADGRAQFQLVHDSPNTTTTAELTPVILADGNVVTHQWSAGEHVFRKYDQDGTLQWSRVLAGNAVVVMGGSLAVTLLNDGNDGFIFAGQDSVRTYSGAGPSPADSLVRSFRIVRINGSGDLTSAVLLKKGYVETPTSTLYLNGFDAARTPGDGVVVSMTAAVAGSGSIDMVKLEPDGAINWCRSVGRPVGSATGPEPTLSNNLDASASMAVSPTGTIYYSEGGDDPSNHLRLGALDPDGSMLWMKRYVYGNTVQFVEYHDIALDATGDVHAGGSLVTAIGRFHIFLRTDATGILERADIYRTPLALMTNGHFGLDDEGRRYHRTPVINLTTNTGSHGFLIADTLGSPARYVRRNDEVIPPNNVFTIPQRIDVAGERLAVSNLLHHQDMDLAYTTRYEALSMFNIDDIAPCLMDDTTYAHIPVPLEPIMTTEDIITAVSLDVSAYYSVEPITLTLTEAVAEGVEPLCEFAAEMLGLNTGTHSATAADPVRFVQNTLLTQGDPILLSSSFTEVEVYDSRGALRQRSPVNNARSLSTTAWPPGMYFIRAVGQEGGIAVGRVVVD